MAFEATIHEVLPELVSLRRELHAHPEIRYEERWTSDRIAAFLDGIVCRIRVDTRKVRGSSRRFVGAGRIRLRCGRTWMRSSWTRSPVSPRFAGPASDACLRT